MRNPNWQNIDIGDFDISERYMNRASGDVYHGEQWMLDYSEGRRHNHEPHTQESWDKWVSGLVRVEKVGGEWVEK